MARRIPQAYAGIEQWLERRYARRGVKYLYECWAAQLAWTMIVFAFSTAGLTLYLEGSTQEFLVMLAVTEALVVVVAGAGIWLWARNAEPAVRWLRGERTRELAPEAWAHTAAAPVRAPLYTIAVALPFEVAASFFAAHLYDSGLESVAVIFGSILLITVSASISVVIFVAQLTIRPGLRDTGRYLPAGFEFPTSRYGLAGQMIGRLTVLGLTMMTVGAGVALITSDPVGRLALGITLAPAILIVLGVLAFPLAALSLLGPVNELIAATRRVAAGDLAASVQVVTSDELGELTQSFNEMTADLQRMTADLRESRARIVAASDASRRRVERDLHDGAQQDLVLVNLKLGLLEHRLTGAPETAALVSEARADLGRALEQLRDLAHGIYPAVLENDGLAGALADAAQRAPIPAQLECDGAGRYPRELEAAVYFCCLEALQNAGKHAGDDARATITLAAANGELRFEVSDDGRGFDVPAGTPGAGIQNMVDRIGAVGGELAVDSLPGRGTTVRGKVPVPAVAAPPAG